MDYKLPKKPKIKEKVIQPDQRRFCVVPLRAVIDKRLTYASLRALCLLASYCNKAGFTYVSLARMGNDLGISQASIHRQIKKLEALGFIKQFPSYHANIKGKTKRIIYDENITDREAEQIAGEPREAHTRDEIKALYAQKRINNNNDITNKNMHSEDKQTGMINSHVLTRLKSYVSNERESQRLEALINDGHPLDKLEAYLLQGKSLRYYTG